MNKILKKVLAFAMIFAMLLNISVFASDITPEEKGERKILMTRGGTELSADAVAALQSNLNRYSPLAMGSGTDSGIPAYHLTNNTVATIEVESVTDTFLHRVMADQNYENFSTMITNFEDSVLRLRVASGPYFSKIIDDESGRKNIKIGLSCTKSGGIFATDAKFVQLADYVDLDTMKANQKTYYDVEIPVKDILESEDFYAFNGSMSTMLVAEDINGVTIAMDVGGEKSSLKIMYFTDLYLAYAPQMPQNLSADVTSDSVELSWEYESADSVNFNIFRDGEYLETVTDKIYKDTSLSPDTEYFYQVQAVIGSSASKSAEANVKTNTYFSDVSLLEAGFKDISVNSSSALKGQIVSDTENTVSGKLASDTYTGGAIVVASAYKDGILKDMKIDILDEVTSDGEDFSITVDAEGTDTIKFFAVDSLASLKLISQVGVLNTEGFFEKRISKKADISDSSVEFVSNNSSFDITCENTNSFVALALKEGTTLDSITEENASELIAGIDVCENENTLNLIFDDTKFDDGNYLFYIASAGCSINAEPITEYYATLETVSGIYADLNNSAVTEARAIECIESPVLNLDLTDYKRVSKNEVAKLFVAIKPQLSSVDDISKTLDKAVGAVLFCSPVKKTNEDAKKYAESIGLDTDIVKALSENKGSFADEYTYKLLEEKESEVSLENAAKLFKDAYICALASDADNTWKTLKEVVYTYTDADKSLITSNIDEADVFKAMLDNEYKEVSDIVKKYEDVIYDLKYESYDDGPKKSSGGGGGGRKVSVPKATGIVTPQIPSAPESVQKGVFADLQDSHWAYESVNTLLENNIVSKDANFRPNDTVKREEFAKMLVMIFKPVANKKIEFSDVNENDWFYSYINAAFSGGIVSGISETEFGAGMNISRQDMAKMLYNAISNSVKLEENTEEVKMNFADAEKISDYAKEAVSFLNSHGVISGDDNGYMNPHSSATRAECAAMLSKFLSNRNQIR